MSTTVPIDVSLDDLDEVCESGRTGLYRLYNAADEVIYIGISDDPVARMKQHAADKDWWPEVARKTLVWYSSRTAAEAAETIAIGLEQPRYNKAKRYVRLPEKPFPERSSARSQQSARHATEESRPTARWYENRAESWGHTLPPRHWPEDMWCLAWWARYWNAVGGADGDFNETVGFFCSPESSLDSMYDIEIGRRHGDGHWPPITWVQTDHPGSPLAGPYYRGTRSAHCDTANGPQQPNANAVAAAHERFLNALLRSGRCSFTRSGKRAVAAGFTDANEAAIAGAVLNEIAYGHNLAIGDICAAAALAQAPYSDPFSCLTCLEVAAGDGERVRPECPSCHWPMTQTHEDFAEMRQNWARLEAAPYPCLYLHPACDISNLAIVNTDGRTAA